MTTYYDILKLTTTATMAEIETALNAQYHQWRRLVTHHDPTIVNQANQELQLLEQIRETLTIPEERAAYDTSLNEDVAIGSLADPHHVQSKTTSFIPPSPNSTGASITSPDNTITRTDIWICQNCRTPNTVGTMYCCECGAQVGINCPSCEHVIQASVKHCPMCGVDLKETLHALQIQQ